MEKQNSENFIKQLASMMHSCKSNGFDVETMAILFASALAVIVDDRNHAIQLLDSIYDYNESGE